MAAESEFRVNNAPEVEHQAPEADLDALAPEYYLNEGNHVRSLARSTATQVLNFWRWSAGSSLVP